MISQEMFLLARTILEALALINHFTLKKISEKYIISQIRIEIWE